MSFLSDRFKRITGGHRTGSVSKSYEPRSFSVPAEKSGSKDSVNELREKMEQTDDILKTLSEKLSSFDAAKLDEFRNSVESLFDTQKKETEEIIHKENVKVYRNVQAVVVDETSKVRESMEESAGTTRSKVNAAVVFSVLAFVVSVLHFAFDLLIEAGIF